MRREVLPAAAPQTAWREALLLEKPVMKLILQGFRSLRADRSGAGNHHL